MNKKRMDLVPNVGIGDIFLEAFKHYSQPERSIRSISISERTIQMYRLAPEKFLDFLLWLTHTLFPDLEVRRIKSGVNKQLPLLITSTRMYRFFPCIKTSVVSEPYIIFHTKVRMDGCIHPPDFEFLFKYLSAVKFPMTIVLLGDKVIEKNKEATIHNIQTIYPQLMKLLSANNKILDLTEDSLYSSNSVEGFQRDLSIIHNAVSNISIGWGGNCQIIKAVAKTSLHFVSTWNSPILEAYKGIKDGDQFFDKIDTFCIAIQSLI